MFNILIRHLIQLITDLFIYLPSTSFANKESHCNRSDDAYKKN